MSPKPYATKPIKRGKNYELLAVDTGVPEHDTVPAAILCLSCGRTSHHPEDVRRLYCGWCHAFHER